MTIEECSQKAFFFRKSIPKGEIVRRNDSKTSWCLNANPVIEVSCQLNHLVKIPSSVAPYLIAIADPRIQYDLFVNNQIVLNKIITTAIGDKVNVLVEDCGNTIAVEAKMQYKGDLPDMTGHYFGVELLVSIQLCLVLTICSYCNA